MMNKHCSTNCTELSKNMIFVGMVYDSFEALEEALGKLKLEQPLFLTYLAKKAFAEEVFKCAGEDFDFDLAQQAAQQMSEERVSIQ